MFDEELNFLNYIHVIKKRQWVIIAVLLVVVTLVTVYSFRQIPIYQASARILIEKETPKVLTFQEVLADTADSDYYQTQYKILKSRTLARQVLQKLEMLNPQNRQQLISLPQFSLNAYLANISESLGLSRPLPEAQDANTQEEHLINEFLQLITITPVRGSRLVDISAFSIDRKQTMMLANALADMYISQNLETKLSASKEAVRWLERELDTTRQKLSESETALQKYREEHKIISFEERQNIVMQKLSELNTAVNEAKIKRMGAEAEYQKIKKYNQDQLGSLSQVINNLLIQQLKVELSTLEKDLSELQKKFRGKHPNVLAVQSQIASVRGRLTAESKRIVDNITSQYEIALAQEQELSKALEDQKQEALDLNKKAIKYDEIQREVESNRKIYNELLQRAKETGVSERLETSNISIVDHAILPASPISPNKKRAVLFGSVAGLILGMMVAFFFEYVDNTLRTPDDVKRYLNIPSLGVIPKVFAKEVATYKTRHAADIIVALNPKSNAAEAYRNLRTNVTFSLLNDQEWSLNDGKIILTTSSEPSEGKSCVVANLGIALAQSGSRTLIIDCDFRRPVVHRIFQIADNEVGFADMLTDIKAQGIRKAIKATGIPNLDVLPCGKIPQNPSELLGSTTARMVINALSERYDKILLDSPPVNTVTDPIILTRLADGVVFVLMAGRTKRNIAQRACDQLRDVDATILGAVLNSVDMDKDRYYYSHYKYYAKYYSHSGDKKKRHSQPVSSSSSVALPVPQEAMNEE